MSATDTAAPLGHNRPPLTLPKDEEMLAEMKRKYPEIERELREFDESFATYNGSDGQPLSLSLKDETVAKALSDLIDQAKKSRRTWKAHGTSEKGPVNKLVKVVTNFFTTADEKLEQLLGRYEPVLSDFAKKVEDEQARKRQEEIERQNQRAEEARRAQEASERAAREAEEAAARQREIERQEREAAERATREREESQRRAEEQKAEEARLEKERRDRIKAERERNTANIRDAKAILKSAERLNSLAEAEEANPAELALLEDQIKPRGQISTLMTPVSASPHLDVDQANAVADISTRLQAVRAAADERLTKKRQREREAAQKAEQREQARLAEQRRQEQAEADARLEATRKAREAEEAETARLAQERRDADARARAAREAARGHEKTAREEDKTAGRHEDEAERAQNRGDRLAGREDAKANIRGELGSNSGLARRWSNYIDDEEAIRATLGPLGPHIRLDAIEAATFHWMRAHQAGFEGERVEPKELPGVHFALEEDLVTR